MRVVSVIAFDGVLPFDLSIANEVMGRLRLGGLPAYRVMICSENDEIRAGTGLFNIRAPWRLNMISQAETVIVPGTENPELPISDVVKVAIQDAAARGARIASLSTGSFVLAAAGLLNGQRVASHWASSALLAQRYPLVIVDRQSLIVDNGRILTSAGGSAGIDLCVRLVERDYGKDVGNYAAGLMLTSPCRDHEQDRYIKAEAPVYSDLASLLEWVEGDLSRPLTVEALADQAGMTLRTLNRRFRDHLDTSPMQWLITRRLRKAQELLENSDFPVETISSQVGFETSKNFIERFRLLVGVSPEAYRRLKLFSRP